MNEHELAELLGLISMLGEAIASKDWTEARRIWERVTRLHPESLTANPHLATVLRHQEAMLRIAEQQSTAAFH